MRYDKTVYFAKESKSIYNTATGDYGDVVLTKVSRSADVTDTGVDAMNMLYGKVLQNAKTIRIKGHYHDDFDYIIFENVKYLVNHCKKLRQESVYHVVVKQ